MADTVPSPKERIGLIGHEVEERNMAEAIAGRLHHAWLITGPKGIGKATLAYRFVRRLLTEPVESGHDGLFETEGDEEKLSLAIDPTHPVIARIAAGGHADLMVIERSVDPKTGRLRDEIPVDDIRRLIRFFSLTGAESGRRIAIIDAADEMNRNAANALLKVLEEPPAGGVLLLIAHRPGRLPPTIRSRCRLLPLKPLSVAEIETFLTQECPNLEAADRQAIARLAEGSIGRALHLAGEEGVAVLEDFNDLTAALGQVPAARIHAFAEKMAGPDGEERYRAFQDLLRLWIIRRTREIASADRSADRFTRLEQWLEVWEKVSHLSERADAVHLDRKQVVISLLLSLRSLAQTS